MLVIITASELELGGLEPPEPVLEAFMPNLTCRRNQQPIALINIDFILIFFWEGSVIV